MPPSFFSPPSFSPLPGRPSSIPKLLECPSFDGTAPSVCGGAGGCACAKSNPPLWFTSPPKLTFRRCFRAVVGFGALRGDMNELK